MTQENILAMKFLKSKDASKFTVNYFVEELNRNRTEEINETPHPDLFTALSDLSGYVAKVYHASEDKIGLYEATGFKFDKKEKLILTGKMATDNGSVIGISTPAIDLMNDVYGFEEELNQDINKLLTEVFDFLMGKKVAFKQLTIDDEIEKNESSSERESEHNDEGDDNEPPMDDFTLPE